MRIMTIYGTRPEAIKVAPIIKAIEAEEGMNSIAVVSGQHREMLDQVNALFGISPAHDLNIMTAGQTLNEIVSKVIAGVDEVLRLEEPDAVLVQGDTSTVMGAAIAAFNRQIPVIHLEAGLRSGDISSPFPEEANRKLTSQITELHLAPTQTSKQNLLNEGVSENDIVITGNSVIDALLFATENFDTEFTNQRLEGLRRAKREGAGGRVLLVTAHRRENLGAPMENIGAAVAEIARKIEDLTVVFAVHKNPKVRQAIYPAVEGLANVVLVEPLGYSEFTQAIGLADVVLTDSGGVQEEAPSLGKPVLVMRENTERPEAVEAGTVKLIGTDRSRLVKEVCQLFDSKASYQEMAKAVNPYGDGSAARRTVGAIRWKFASGNRPLDFFAK